ncbi:MAG: (2Fe-2S)-binding protein [Gammaproteobacteria bacterium]|nr:(2Fe-2S)-binding protein [Gammaproteobacteria bacterium]
MYVCVCNRVTDHQIREAADRGVSSLSELSRELKVGTCCGNCRDCAKNLLDEAAQARCQVIADWSRTELCCPA